MSAPLLAALAGLGLGLSLIMAIGAQNAYVLRQGLRREHVLAVVIICALSDLVLITLGVAGAGFVFDRVPWLVTVVRFAGAAFLLVYAALAARRAIRPAKGLDGRRRLPRGPRSAVVITTALALTWLNPHVYLDTLVLLGSIASTHGEHRWWFGVGAGFASIAWFTLLGFGARLLAPVFARPLAWRILDGLIAVVMFAIAVSLVVGGFAGANCGEHRSDLVPGGHRGRRARAGDRDGCRDRRRVERGLQRGSVCERRPGLRRRCRPRRSCRRPRPCAPAPRRRRRHPAPRARRARRASSRPARRVRLSAMAASVSSSTPASSHASCAFGIRMSTSCSSAWSTGCTGAGVSTVWMPSPRATTNASQISSIGRSNCATRYRAPSMRLCEPSSSR